MRAARAVWLCRAEGRVISIGLGGVVPEATYVAIVSKQQRGKLRALLQSEDMGDLSWREKKRLFGSEFYFSGPPTLARQAHAYVTKWLASHH